MTPAKSLAIETIVRSSDEGTCSYQKFAVLDGIIIGEVIPCAHNNMRFKEAFNQESPPPSTPGKAELMGAIKATILGCPFALPEYVENHLAVPGLPFNHAEQFAKYIYMTIQPYLRGDNT